MGLFSTDEIRQFTSPSAPAPTTSPSFSGVGPTDFYRDSANLIPNPGSYFPGGTNNPTAPVSTGPANPPGFFDPNNPLYQYHDPSTTTNAVFQQGINAAAPTTGISPNYQAILDSIKQQQDYANGVSSANAQSLAAKRGLSGSSIEQFGVQQGLAQNSQAAQGAIQSTLAQNAAQNNQLQQLQAQLYGSRANSLAGFNSDELASLRNADYSRQYLQLQQQLGQRGLDIAQQNIGANQDIANQNARNGLINSGVSLLAPYLLGTPGSGLLSNFFGSSSASGVGTGAGSVIAGGGAVPYGGAGTPGSSFFPGGVGPVGTNAPGYFGSGGTIFNTSGTSGLSGASAAAGLGGYYAANRISPASQSGDQGAMNVGGAAGGFAGSAFGPGGAAAGAAAGTFRGKVDNRMVNAVDKSLGGTAGSIARYITPTTGVAAVTSKLKSVASSVTDVFPF